MSSRQPAVSVLNRLTMSLVCGVAIAAALQACGPDLPTVPAEEVELLAARGGGGGGGGGKTSTEIKISALDPDTVPADTVLIVRVLGSGFTAGSQVSWNLAGVPTSKVSTSGPVLFISSSELRAPVTIQPDAPLASYDVVVTAAGGKKGIGMELLEVVAKPIVLPVPDGTVRSRASDVNDSGVIVGTVIDAAGQQLAVRWTPLGDTWAVEVLGPGSAVAINDEGYIVRRAYDSVAERYDSWVVTPVGGEVYVGEVYVHSIANTGTLIGLAGPNGQRAPVVWRRVSATTWGPPMPLPAPTGHQWWEANAISDRDDIAGHSYTDIHPDGTPSGLEWAAVSSFSGGQWGPTVLVDTELGGAAMAMNIHGAIAGGSWPCSEWDPARGCDPSRPVFWAGVGAPRQLLADPYYGVFTGPVTAMVNDMNNSDQIVGWSRVPMAQARKGTTNTHAVVWLSPSASMPLDLGAAVGRWFTEAVAINDAGLAVGYGRQPTFKDQAMAWRIP
ncbi:MAG: hypothetical protein Q8W45_06940 [Candidatus Palauibacterales bacterium]|nr:hypothetical protein [Candidatus Palauibacterales bacterium]